MRSDESRKAFGLKMTKPCTSEEPLVQELYELLRSDPRTALDISVDIGVDNCTISNWFRRSSPNLSMFNKVLNGLGFELKIVRLPDGKG